MLLGYRWVANLIFTECFRQIFLFSEVSRLGLVDKTKVKSWKSAASLRCNVLTDFWTTKSKMNDLKIWQIWRNVFSVERLGFFEVFCTKFCVSYTLMIYPKLVIVFSYIKKWSSDGWMWVPLNDKSSMYFCVLCNCSHKQRIYKKQRKGFPRLGKNHHMIFCSLELLTQKFCDSKYFLLL